MNAFILFVHNPFDSMFNTLHYLTLPFYYTSNMQLLLISISHYSFSATLLQHFCPPETWTRDLQLASRCDTVVDYTRVSVWISWGIQCWL